MESCAVFRLLACVLSPVSLGGVLDESDRVLYVGIRCDSRLMLPRERGLNERGPSHPRCLNHPPSGFWLGRYPAGRKGIQHPAERQHNECLVLPGSYPLEPIRIAMGLLSPYDRMRGRRFTYIVTIDGGYKRLWVRSRNHDPVLTQCVDLEHPAAFERFHHEPSPLLNLRVASSRRRVGAQCVLGNVCSLDSRCPWGPTRVEGDVHAVQSCYNILIQVGIRYDEAIDVAAALVKVPEGKGTIQIGCAADCWSRSDGGVGRGIE